MHFLLQYVGKTIFTNYLCGKMNIIHYLLTGRDLTDQKFQTNTAIIDTKSVFIVIGKSLRPNRM